MTKTPGRCWSIIFRDSALVVSKVAKRNSPVSWSRWQATLLYLPRSMAKMEVFLNAVVVIVFMMQAFRAGCGVCLRGNFQTTTPPRLPHELSLRGRRFCRGHANQLITQRGRSKVTGICGWAIRPPAQGESQTNRHLQRER